METFTLRDSGTGLETTVKMWFEQRDYGVVVFTEIDGTKQVSATFSNTREKWMTRTDFNFEG